MMKDEKDIVYTSVQIADILESTNSVEWAEREWVPLLDESLDKDLDDDGVDYDEESDLDYDEGEDEEQQEVPKTLVVTTEEGVPVNDPVDDVGDSVVEPVDVPVKKAVKKRKVAKRKRRSIKQALGLSPEDTEAVEDKDEAFKPVVCIVKGCSNFLGAGEKGMCPGCKKEHGVA